MRWTAVARCNCRLMFCICLKPIANGTAICSPFATNPGAICPTGRAVGILEGQHWRAGRSLPDPNCKELFYGMVLTIKLKQSVFTSRSTTSLGKVTRKSLNSPRFNIDRITPVWDAPRRCSQQNCCDQLCSLQHYPTRPNQNLEPIDLTYTKFN